MSDKDEDIWQAFERVREETGGISFTPQDEWKAFAYAKLGVERDRMTPEQVRIIQDFIEM